MSNAKKQRKDPAVAPANSLRTRKQQQAREAIVEAAHELFAKHGFDKVTVADIAARAEVGRATFFRYFRDKQEVIFGDDQEPGRAVREISQLRMDGPIGDSLPAALAHVRAWVLAFVGTLVEQPELYARHERLIATHAELQARSLEKQRRYVVELAKLLEQHGAAEQVSVLAAELGLACFYAGRTTSGDDPRRLVDAIDAAFEQLSKAVGSVPRRRSTARTR